MEQQPQNNEQMDYHRPPLDIDLSGPDGNVFNVISIAGAQLTGHALEEFNRLVWQATEAGAGRTYQDILQIVNTYLDLTDTSDMYPQYGRPAHIIAAVDALNAHLQLLPPTVTSEIAALYPEFDNPERGPERYGRVLDDEIQRVQGEVARAGEDTVYDWLDLQNRLRDTVTALRRAGVVW